MRFYEDKKPACNKRFGASGGVVSSDTEQVTSSFALVLAFAIPPPAAKPPDRCASAVDRRQKNHKSLSVNQV